MAKSYFFSSCVVFALLMGTTTPLLAPRENNLPISEEKISTKGRALLGIIKKTIDTALSASNDGLWPRSALFLKTADQNISMLYLHKEKYKSAIADACMTYLEDFLEQLSNLPSHKLHKNSHEVIDLTNTTLTNLQTIAVDLSHLTNKNNDESDNQEISPQDQLFLDKSVKFTLFMRTSFMPPLAIYNGKTSWFQTAQEKVCKVVNEYPFACGVAVSATVVAIYWYLTRNQEASSDSGKNGGGSEGGWHKEAERAHKETMDLPPAVEGTDFDVEGKECARQHGANCAYHTGMNTTTIIHALEAEQQRVGKPKLNPAEIEAIIKRLELPSTETIEKAKADFIAESQQKTEENIKTAREVFRKAEKKIKKVTTVDIEKLPETMKSLKKALKDKDTQKILEIVEKNTNGRNTFFNEIEKTAGRSLERKLSSLKTAKAMIVNKERSLHELQTQATLVADKTSDFARWALQKAHAQAPTATPTTLAEALEDPFKQSYYFGTLDYLQHAPADRRALIKGRVVRDKILANEKLRTDIESALRNSMNDAQEINWEILEQILPKEMPIEDLRAAKYLPELCNTDSWGVFLNAVKACQEGKPLVLEDLNTSGSLHGMGHWTSKVVLPDGESVPPKKLRVIDMDSLGGGKSVGPLFARFLKEALTLKLPEPTEGNTMRDFFNTDRITALSK